MISIYNYYRLTIGGSFLLLRRLYPLGALWLNGSFLIIVTYCYFIGKCLFMGWIFAWSCCLVCRNFWFFSWSKTVIKVLVSFWECFYIGLVSLLCCGRLVSVLPFLYCLSRYGFISAAVRFVLPLWVLRFRHWRYRSAAIASVEWVWSGSVWGRRLHWFSVFQSLLWFWFSQAMGCGAEFRAMTNSGSRHKRFVWCGALLFWLCLFVWARWSNRRASKLSLSGGFIYSSACWVSYLLTGYTTVCNIRCDNVRDLWM